MPLHGGFPVCDIIWQYSLRSFAKFPRRFFGNITLMKARLFPKMLVVLIVVIAVVNAFANHYYWYWQMRWFDMPMHFSGGAWISGTVIWWRFFSGNFPVVIPRSFSYIAMWGIGIAFLVGFGWELYEMIVSQITVGHVNAISDTLSDLIFDILGGLVVSVGVWIKTKNN